MLPMVYKDRLMAHLLSVLLSPLSSTASLSPLSPLSPLSSLSPLSPLSPLWLSSLLLSLWLSASSSPKSPPKQLS